MSASAGWYPDPHDAAQLRWWDGFAWTEHTQANVAPPEPRFEEQASGPMGIAGPGPGAPHGADPYGSHMSGGTDGWSNTPQYGTHPEQPGAWGGGADPYPQNGAFGGGYQQDEFTQPGHPQAQYPQAQYPQEAYPPNGYQQDGYQQGWGPQTTNPQPGFPPGTYPQGGMTSTPGGWGQYPGQGRMLPGGEKPNNYLVPAILSGLLCCLPLGLLSTNAARQVDKAWAAGDVERAYAKSAEAKKFTILGAVLGAVGLVIVLVYTMLTGVDPNAEGPRRQDVPDGMVEVVGGSTCELGRAYLDNLDINVEGLGKVTLRAAGDEVDAGTIFQQSDIGVILGETFEPSTACLRTFTYQDGATEETVQTVVFVGTYRGEGSMLETLETKNSTPTYTRVEAGEEAFLISIPGTNGGAPLIGVVRTGDRTLVVLDQVVDETVLKELLLG